MAGTADTFDGHAGGVAGAGALPRKLNLREWSRELIGRGRYSEVEAQGHSITMSFRTAMGDYMDELLEEMAREGAV